MMESDQNPNVMSLLPEEIEMMRQAGSAVMDKAGSAEKVQEDQFVEMGDGSEGKSNPFSEDRTTPGKRKLLPDSLAKRLRVQVRRVLLNVPCDEEQEERGEVPEKMSNRHADWLEKGRGETTIFELGNFVVTIPDLKQRGMIVQLAQIGIFEYLTVESQHQREEDARKTRMVLKPLVQFRKTVSLLYDSLATQIAGLSISDLPTNGENLTVNRNCQKVEPSMFVDPLKPDLKVKINFEEGTQSLELTLEQLILSIDPQSLKRALLLKKKFGEIRWRKDPPKREENQEEVMMKEMEKEEEKKEETNEEEDPETECKKEETVEEDEIEQQVKLEAPKVTVLLFQSALSSNDAHPLQQKEKKGKEEEKEEEGFLEEKHCVAAVPPLISLDLKGKICGQGHLISQGGDFSLEFGKLSLWFYELGLLKKEVLSTWKQLGVCVVVSHNTCKVFFFLTCFFFDSFRFLRR